MYVQVHACVRVGDEKSPLRRSAESVGWRKAACNKDPQHFPSLLYFDVLPHPLRGESPRAQQEFPSTPPSLWGPTTNSSFRVTSYFQRCHIWEVSPSRATVTILWLNSVFCSGALWRPAPCPPRWKPQALFLEGGPQCLARGTTSGSPPPPPSGLCTCRGWQAGQASRSECWSGLWKAAPKPGKEKNGLFLYRQGSDSSCVILGDVHSTVKGSDCSASCKERRSQDKATLFFRHLCLGVFGNTPLLQTVWQVTCWPLSCPLLLSSLLLIFSIASLSNDNSSVFFSFLTF